MKTEKKPTIIFICSHNSSRSQIAEAFLRDFAGDYFTVYSAGLERTSVNPLTIIVMEEIGYNLSEHYSKEIEDFKDKINFDIMITVCSDAEEKCPTLPGVHERLFWVFENPSSYKGTEEEKLAKFREVRDQIRTKILSWLKEAKGISLKTA